MAKDCLVFVNTGFCSFKGNCRFRHPTPANAQKVEKEGSNGNVSGNAFVKVPINPCKFFLEGNCYKGDSCQFEHSMPYVVPEYNRQFNSIGLPYRVGVRECSFYIRYGACAFGAACRYHHPDPYVYNNPDQMYVQPYQAAGNYQYQYEYGRSSGVNNGGYYPQGDTTTYQLQTGNQVSGNTYGMDSYDGSANFNNSVSLNDDGLPQRSWKQLCWHYERTGWCMYGQSCAFDHPPKVSSGVGEASTSSAPDAQDKETHEE